MLDGCDVSFPTENPTLSMKLAVQLIFNFWPEAVVEDAKTGDVLPTFFTRLPEEVFIYADEEAYDSWATKGAISENANRMIHLLRDSDLLTIVVDDPQEPSVANLLKTIRKIVSR